MALTKSSTPSSLTALSHQENDMFRVEARAPVCLIMWSNLHKSSVDPLPWLKALEESASTTTLSKFSSFAYHRERKKNASGNLLCWNHCSPTMWRELLFIVLRVTICHILLLFLLKYDKQTDLRTNPSYRRYMPFFIFYNLSHVLTCLHSWAKFCKTLPPSFLN